MVIKRLKNDFEQAELLRVDVNEFKLSVENWELQETSAQNLTKRSLRVMKENRQGSNYSFGSSKKSFESLLQGALESVEYGSRPLFTFSSHTLDTRREEEEKRFSQVAPEEIFSFLDRFMEYFREKQVDLNLNIHLGKRYREQSILTTNTGDLKDGTTDFHLFFSTPIPGGGSSLSRGLYSPSFFTSIPKEEIESFLLDYSYCQEVSIPESGRLPVIFSPRSLFFLPICLEEGVSGRNLFYKTSPLKDRLGEELFSSHLTIEDQPHMENSPNRRSFDDEGIPTTKKVLVERGVLKEYIYDLESAARLKEEPRGNGMKQALFGGDIHTPVTPSLINPVIAPGTSSREAMVKDVEEGILVESIVGFHSSNYPQGQFSVQAHGFHMKEGEIKGRLEDVMIAGNIYEDFKRVEALGDKLYLSYFGYAPYILVDGVSVTGC